MSNCSCLVDPAAAAATGFLFAVAVQTGREQQWLTASEFNNYYALGQFVPGPNMLMVSLIGLHAAIIDVLLALIAIVVALLVLFTKIKAPWLMAAGALCGFLFFA